MKSLAIASFILGIIGFLFSFIFGLGILPSILAVVFGIIPLIKKIHKAMAISGLILGLLGIFISLSFFTQKPEDIIKQTLKEIPQERKARPSKTEINLGEGIRIGGLLIIFDSVKITKTYNTGRSAILTGKSIIKKAKPNYKFVVIKVKGKNVGKKKEGLWLWGTEEQDYKIEVDKGYFYDPIIEKSILNINLMPEETGEDELVFEILKSTKPVKLHALIKGQRFTVNLKLKR